MAWGCGWWRSRRHTRCAHCRWAHQLAARRCSRDHRDARQDQVRVLLGPVARRGGGAALGERDDGHLASRHAHRTGQAAARYDGLGAAVVVTTEARARARSAWAIDDAEGARAAGVVATEAGAQARRARAIDDAEGARRRRTRDIDDAEGVCRRLHPPPPPTLQGAIS